MQLMNLKTKYLGKKFEFYKIIDSTQNEIWRRIKRNQIENGTLIMADIQTNGVGTHGRVWYTDETENIAFSIFLETNCFNQNIEGITTEIAEILVQIFKRRYNIDLTIKNPNDIMCKGKKIGGILTESKVNGDNTKFLIIGIGINTKKTNFSDDIKEIATSIKKEFNVDVNRIEVISEFCNEFEKIIDRRIRK